MYSSSNEQKNKHEISPSSYYLFLFIISKTFSLTFVINLSFVLFHSSSKHFQIESSQFKKLYHIDRTRSRVEDWHKDQDTCRISRKHRQISGTRVQHPLGRSVTTPLLSPVCQPSPPSRKRRETLLQIIRQRETMSVRTRESLPPPRVVRDRVCLASPLIKGAPLVLHPSR